MGMLLENQCWFYLLKPETTSPTPETLTPAPSTPKEDEEEEEDLPKREATGPKPPTSLEPTSC